VERLTVKSGVGALRVLVTLCLLINAFNLFEVKPVSAYSDIFLEDFETGLDGWETNADVSIATDESYNGTKCAAFIDYNPYLDKSDYWSNEIEMDDAGDYWVSFAYKSNATHNDPFKVNLMDTVWLWFEDDTLRFIVIDNNYVYPANIVEVGSAQIVLGSWNWISVHIIIDSGTDGFYALYVGDTMTNSYNGDNSARLNNGDVEFRYSPHDPPQTYPSFFIDYFVVYTGREDVYPPVISGSVSLTVDPETYGGGVISALGGVSPDYTFTARIDTDFNATVRYLHVDIPLGVYDVVPGSVVVSGGKWWTATYSAIDNGYGNTTTSVVLIQGEDEDGLEDGEYIEIDFIAKVALGANVDYWECFAYYQSDGWYLSLMNSTETTTENLGNIRHAISTTPQFVGVDMGLHFGYTETIDDIDLWNYTITIPSNFHYSGAINGDYVQSEETILGRVVSVTCTVNTYGLVFTGYADEAGSLDFIVDWYVYFNNNSSYGWLPSETVTVEALEEVETFDDRHSHNFADGWDGWGHVGGYSADATGVSYGLWTFLDPVTVGVGDAVSLTCEDPNNFNYLYSVYAAPFSRDFEITVGFEPASTDTPVLTVLDENGVVLFMIVTNDGDLNYVTFNDPDQALTLLFDGLPIAYNSETIGSSPSYELNTVKAEFDVGDGTVAIYSGGSLLGTYAANNPEVEGRIVVLGDWWGINDDLIGVGAGEFVVSSYNFFMEGDTLGGVRLWCLIIGLILLLSPPIYMATRPEWIGAYLYSPVVMVLGAALLVYMSTI